MSAGRAELASEVARGVYIACLRSKEYRKKALDQRDGVQDYCRRLAERQAAEARFEANPEDAEAHLALGRNLCLDDDWKSGLPHLAKGSDHELRQLAERDLASPSEPAVQVELADDWWTLGRRGQGDNRDLLLLRAGFWYDLAHGNLSSGLERLKAEKRLEELAEVRRPLRRRRPSAASRKGLLAGPLERPVLNSFSNLPKIVLEFAFRSAKNANLLPSGKPTLILRRS